MKFLNYNQLYYFYTVASEGSIKLAAKKLHLTQPTISSQIKTLEKNLEVSLFTRGHRNLKLTEKGKDIYKKAARIFRIGKVIINELEGNNTSLNKATIAVGATPTISEHTIFKFLAELWGDSKYSIQLEKASISQLLEHIKISKLDVVLTNSLDKKPPALKAKYLSTDKFVGFAASGFSFDKSDLKTSIEGKKYFKYLVNNEIYQNIENFFNENNFSLQEIGSANCPDFIKQAVEKENAFSVLPESCIYNEIDQGKYKILFSVPGATITTWGLLSKQAEQCIAIQRSLNSAQEKGLSPTIAKSLLPYKRNG